MTSEELLRVVFLEHGTSTLGWMFAAAMVIGWLLDENFRNLRGWLFAIATFFVIQEIVRYDLLQTVSHSAQPALIGTNVVIFLTYATGLSTGWFLVYFGKRRGRKEYRDIKNGQDNGSALDKAQKNET